MALQKWAAPAGTPLLATETATGSGSAAYSVTFASSGDIAVGAQLRIHASGTLTTTGAPTLAVQVTGPDDTGTYVPTITCAADVTDQSWTLDATATVRSTTSVVYDISTSGLGGADTRDVSIVTVGELIGTWAIALSWDTADAGDTISMLSADALWIG